MKPSTTIRTLLIERSIPTYTNCEETVLGRLFINGSYFCDTLEKRSCLIPEGIYQIAYCDSPRFNRKLPLVHGEDVPANKGIRMHAGNSIKDTSGCILIGEEKNNRLVNSRNWVDNLCFIFDRDSRYEKTILVVTNF